MRASFQAAVEPFYSFARANEPIGLFRGRVDLAGPSASERHRGGVVLEWLPSPTLRAWAQGTASEFVLQSITGNANVEIVPRTPRRYVPRQGKGTRRRRNSVRGSFETETPLLAWECGDPAAALSYGVLHVVNVSLLHGSPIAWPDGSSTRGRHVLRGGDP